MEPALGINPRRRFFFVRHRCCGGGRNARARPLSTTEIPLLPYREDATEPVKAMGRIGATELLIIALIALLLFGASRLADIGKGLGEGIKNFKKGLRDDDGSEPKQIELTSGPPKELEAKIESEKKA